MRHIHWLGKHEYTFTDKVSGKAVYLAHCRCGQWFMVDSLNPLPFFKVKSKGPPKINYELKKVTYERI